jgi:hypothetical protein
VRLNLLAVVHSGYWGMYLLLVSLVLAMVRAPHARAQPLTGLLLAWPVLVMAVAPGAAAFYASYGPLFSRFLARRRLAAMFAGGLGISLGASALGLCLALILFGPRQPVFSRSGELVALVVTLSGIAAVHVAIGLVIRGFVGWWQAGPDVREDTNVSAAPPAPARGDVIFVKTEHRLEKVRLDEILIIEGQRDYRRIHTTTRRIMTLQTFAEFERQLPSELVCRVHKSYMVAVGRIDSIERGQIAIQNLTIPISHTYRDRFLALIGQR